MVSENRQRKPPPAATPRLTVWTHRPLLPLAAECIAVRPAILQVGLDHVQLPPAHVTASVAEQDVSAAAMRAGVETQAVGLLS